jgi:hypothetical protein
MAGSTPGFFFGDGLLLVPSASRGQYKVGWRRSRIAIGSDRIAAAVRNFSSGQLARLLADVYA